MRPPGEPYPWPWTMRWLAWVAAWMASEVRAAVREAMGSRGDGAVSGRVRTALGVLVVVGVVPTVIGLIDDTGGFLGATLAGLSSLVLGALLAVTLIDSLLRERRREQWVTVRDEIRAAVCGQVVDLGTSVYVVLRRPGPFMAAVGDEPATPRAEVAAQLRALAAEADACLDDLVRDPSLDRSSSRVVHADAEPALAPLRGLTTTRVIALGDEPALVAQLLRFERRTREWEDWIGDVERRGAPDRLAWREAIATLRAAIDVYDYFVANP